MGIVCAPREAAFHLKMYVVYLLGWTIAHIPNLLSFLSAIYSLPTGLGLLLLMALHFKGAVHTALSH